MAKNEDDLMRTRTTLLGRLKDLGDSASWQEFFDIYWQLIYGVARKSGLSDAEAEDVVQETMAAVAKQMPNFTYDPAIGSFKAWLLTQTRWRIADQFRKRGPASPHRDTDDETGRTAAIERIPDEKSDSLDAIWEQDWQQAAYAGALARIKQRLDPQKFQIFDFHVHHEWPPEKVAQAFRITVNQVYLVKHRVLEMLREEVLRLEREMK